MLFEVDTKLGTIDLLYAKLRESGAYSQSPELYDKNGCYLQTPN